MKYSYKIVWKNHKTPIIEKMMKQSKSEFRKGRRVQIHIFTIKKFLTKSYNVERKRNGLISCIIEILNLY